MAIADQVTTDQYAIYNGDCVEVVGALPNECVHLSVYSPPFAGLYHYSSNERDMSNCRSYDEFMEHYGHIVRELHRVALPGRVTAVHCTDVPSGNTGRDKLRDFPGDIIRLHESMGWDYCARYAVWKDPFVVYLRTMQKSLQHRTCAEDSSRCSVANADYLLMFRKRGDNAIPIAHPTGLMSYSGSREAPKEVLKYRGHVGNQIENRYSQWVWRQYASAFWDDVRLERVLPFQASKDENDEKHVHPLQLDVIDRAVVLWSNPGEVVLTPFMGVGSECFSAVQNGRFGVGAELKPSYFRQAVKNMAKAGVVEAEPQKQIGLFDALTPPAPEVMDESAAPADDA